MENTIKRLAMSVLPSPILYRLWHLRRRSRPRTADANAKDQRVIPICDGAYLEVYWTDAPLGSGPCVSMFVLREEVMRIDCLGGDAGHMHLNPVQQGLLVGWGTTPRIFFPPESSERQIDRAVFEVGMNTPMALQSNQLARVRGFTINKKKLEDAAQEMRAFMEELVASHASE